GYVVLCDDPVVFDSLYPGVSCIGGFDYGLGGGGDFIALFDAQDTEIDSLEYDDKAPWPTEPDGDGATLELIDPLFDNALATSWAASSGNGTPGVVNDAQLLSGSGYRNR
ncbi:MAG: hypothetical protein AB8G18_15930, partial [Gammaproteobacteria bacterium]